MTYLGIVVAAEASAGLGYGGERERSIAYAAWIHPNDDLKWALEAARTEWSCGLEALACLRDDRVDAPELGWKYHDHVGSCFASLKAIADRAGARVSSGDPRWEDGPDPSDILIVAGPHARVVTARDGLAFKSVDGGGQDEHGRCIRAREWSLARNGNAWMTSDHGAVLWWIKSADLPRIPLSTPSEPE